MNKLQLFWLEESGGSFRNARNGLFLRGRRRYGARSFLYLCRRADACRSVAPLIV
jgi:hypothetical protein